VGRRTAVSQSAACSASQRRIAARVASLTASIAGSRPEAASCAMRRKPRFVALGALAQAGEVDGIGGEQRIAQAPGCERASGSATAPQARSGTAAPSGRA
jgi:hypothetical protein